MHTDNTLINLKTAHQHPETEAAEWNSTVYAWQMESEGVSLWSHKLFFRRYKTIEQAQNGLLNLTKKPMSFDVKIRTSEGFENQDKTAFMTRLKKILEKSGYEVSGDWKKWNNQGFIYPYQFVIKVIRSLS